MRSLVFVLLLSLMIIESGWIPSITKFQRPHLYYYKLADENNNKFLLIERVGTLNSTSISIVKLGVDINENN